MAYYPNYINIAPVDVTAPMTTEAERAEYFRTHDENGNLIIPNEFAPPNVPKWGATLANAGALNSLIDAGMSPQSYNQPYPYSFQNLAAVPGEVASTMVTGLAALPYMMYKTGDWNAKSVQQQVQDRRDMDAYLQKYTYSPRLKASQQALEGIGDTLDTLKIPPLGVPELYGISGTRRVLPSDVQVLHGRGKQAVQDVRNIPTDFYNAQQGITKDRPTFGASLQGLAQSYGDTRARSLQRYYDNPARMSPFFTPPSEMGKSHIISPGNVQLITAKDPGSGLNIGGYSPAMLNRILPGREVVGNGDSYLDTYHNIHPQLEDLYTQYRLDERSRLYPGVDADEAREMMRQDANAQGLSTIDMLMPGFSRTQEVTALGLPTYPEEYQAQATSAALAASTAAEKYIRKHLGAQTDPMLALAQQGIVNADPNEMRRRYQLDADEIAGFRERVGYPRKGQSTVKKERAEQALAEAHALTPALVAQRNAAHSEWQGINDALTELGEDTVADTDHPAYLEALSALNKHQTEVNNLTQTIDDLSIGEAYEGSSDVAMRTSIDAASLKDMYQRHYPDYDEHAPWLDKTPADARLYDVDVVSTLSNLKGEIDAYYKGVRDKKINPATTPFIAFMEGRAKTATATRREAEATVKASESKRKEYLQQRVMQAPANQRYGKAWVIENDANTPHDQVMRDFSASTWYMDICLGQGGQCRDNQLNPITGRPQGYLPLVAPETGLVWDGSHGNPTTYVADLKAGDVVGHLLDSESGVPVGAVQLRASGDRKYSLGYVSGPKNDEIAPKYAESLRDYLNSKANVIEAGDTKYNVYQTGVYDTLDGGNMDRFIRGSSRLGITENDMDVIVRDLPRYVTAEDMKAAVDTYKAERVQSTPLAVVQPNEVTAYLQDMEHEDVIDVMRQDLGMSTSAIHRVLSATALADYEPLRAVVQQRMEQDPGIHALYQTEQDTPVVDGDFIGGDWEPEPPMTLPAGDTMQNQVTEADVDQRILGMDPIVVQQSLAVAPDVFRATVRAQLEQDPAGLTPEEVVQRMPNILNMLRDTAGVRELQVAFENPQTRTRYTPEQLVAIDNAISSRMVDLVVQEAAPQTSQSIAQEYQQLSAIRTQL